MSEPKDEFLEGGGSQYPALKFENIGDTHSGVVVEYKKLEDRDPAGVAKKWDNGDPKYVYVFTLNTGDPSKGDKGVGNIWVRGNMVKVIREAAQEAGVTAMVGTTIKVRYDSDGEQTKKGYSKPKLFKAKVEPAVTNAGSPDEMW